MIERHPERDDTDLRAAFQALAESSTGECSREDLDRIWLAVGGELPAAERRDIVERLASEPAWAEACVWPTNCAGISARQRSRNADRSGGRRHG